MNRESDYFLRALDLPPAERAAFLDEIGREDPALRQRLERLLRAQSAATDGFLHDPVINRAELSPAPVEEQPGDQIDRYTLVRRIGEGGCGVVWLADQTEPVRRQVALKVIKLGMDTAQVIKRFEAERQALALMDHPHIARVYDAGATAKGRPFFVMEYVDGDPITTYCDAHNLSVPDRLAVFQRVCEAIQHAHQKGIIHRDVKPSNILVAIVDGAPAPKVIDFGIAKAIEQPLSDATLLTQVGQFLGTPAYMSPEQSALNAGDIDTRTDVYSLGVLLYELLAGKPPFDPQALLGVGLEAMWQQIREVDPPRPSTRLQTLSPEELSATAAKRLAEAPKLIVRVSGDLDWIAMRCLEKDRAGRYDSAADLSRDIQRHLNNEPVEARPAGAGYRLAKLVRRNRLAFAAAAALALALLAGTVVSTWQAVRANRAERAAVAAGLRAQDEAAAANAVAGFLADDILRQVDVFYQSEIHGDSNPDLTVRDALLRAAANVEGRFPDQPLVEARLRMAIGFGLQSLNLKDAARPQFERAYDLRVGTLGKHHALTRETRASLATTIPQNEADEAQRLMRELIAEYEAEPELSPAEWTAFNDLRSDFALNLANNNHPAEAEPVARDVAEHNERRLGPQNVRTLRAWKNLAYVLDSLGRFDEAFVLLERMRDEMVTAFGEESAEVVLANNNLASLLSNMGRASEAVPLIERTREVGERVLGPDVFVMLTLRSNLASALDSLRRHEEAIAVLLPLLADGRRVLGEGHPFTVTMLNNLAGNYTNLGRTEEALAMQEQLQSAVSQAFGPEHPNTAISLNNLGRARMSLGQYEAAARDFEEAWQRLSAVLGPDHPNVLLVRGNVSVNLEKQDRWAESELTRRTIWDAHRAARGADHRATVTAGRALARTLLKAGRPGEAWTVWDALLTALENSAAEGAVDQLNAQRALFIEDLLDAGEAARAEPLLRLLLAAREASAPDDWKTFNTRVGLGRALLETDRAAEAEPWLLAGYEGMRARREQDPANVDLRSQRAVESLVRLYELLDRPTDAAKWRAEQEARAQTESEPPADR